MNYLSGTILQGLGRRTSRRRLSKAAIAVIAATSLASGCSGDGGSDDDTLAIGVRNVAVPQAQLFWMEAEGYFDDAGIDVDIKVGEAAQTSQLVAGQTELYMGAQGGTLGIINSGKTVHTIYGTDSNTAGWVVSSDDEITNPADCTTVTTAPPGTVMHAWTRELERIYDAEWELTQLTTVPAISSNVSAGRTDCAIGNISYYQGAIDEGRVRVILDPTDEAARPSNWPDALGAEGVFAGTPETLMANKADVETFLRVYHEALADYLETDSAAIARTLIESDSDWAAVGSEGVLTLSVDQYKPLLEPNEGFVDEQTWTSTVNFFKAGGLDFVTDGPGPFEYANAVDMSYYEEAIGTDD